MANRSLSAQAKNSRGDELTLHAQDTDAPILPVASLEHLHEFRPDLVDFVITQTATEARTAAIVIAITHATIGTLVVTFVTHNILRKRQ